MPGHKRITVSLTPEIVSQLDELSSLMGVSRSAFLTAVLGDVLPPMVSMSNIAVNAASGGSEASQRRYRGELIAELSQMVGDLQSGVVEIEDELLKREKE